MLFVTARPRLLLLLACAVTPAPMLGMTQFTIPRLREMARQGSTSLDYIMGVVMMNLPRELMSRIRNKLSLRTPTGRGFVGLQGVESGSFPFSIPSPQGQAGGSSGNANITTNNDDETSDTGTITNINNNEPVRLNIGRRKRSFGFFDNNHFPTAGSFGPSGHGNVGPFHHPGASYGGFGQPKGYNHPESSGHVHPGDQNGNLFGGTATSYIKYPGSTHHYGGYNSLHGSHFGHNSGFNKENCPRQADQGFVYQYDSDSLTYPAIEIGNELFTRSLPGSDLLFQALNRQIVFPTDPPQIFIDEFLLSSNVTCPFTEKQVWSYTSQTFTGRCYPLVNFQELPFFKTCLNRFCKNCGGVKADFFWGHSATNSANVCVTEYETLTLWSYCEELEPSRRIVSDRILVPNACTCATVPCPSYTGYHK